MNTNATISPNPAVAEADSSPTYLVIGYGCANHGHNAIGYEVASLLRSLNLPNVEVCAVEKLTPALAKQLATVDYAIFVDTCRMKKQDIKVSPLEACGLETSGSSVPGWDHSWHPCSVLAMTHSLYARHPQAWWVEVSAYDAITGHYQAHEAHQRVQDAVREIQGLIHQTSLL